MSGRTASATSAVKSTHVSRRASICAMSARTRGTRAPATFARLRPVLRQRHPQKSGPYQRRLPSDLGWPPQPRAPQAEAMTTTHQALSRPTEYAVTPEQIFQLAQGFMASKHLFAASELGLFEALGEGPATLAGLASR